MFDIKHWKFITYTKVKLQGSIEESTKDNSTPAGFRDTISRMSFAKKDIDEEGFGGPEEEVFLLMSTENFYIVPLDLNEH